MDLFFRKLGEGFPLIILHGLYGCSDNWHSMGRELGKKHTVYMVDLRNHGQSPHLPEHNYDVLSEDIRSFLEKHDIPRADILGHSMGGKTALAFAIKYPERIRKMVIVDISPLQYDEAGNSPEAVSHYHILESLNKLDLVNIHSRHHADEILKQTIPSSAIRQFLLKNLKLTPDGKFHWAMNLKAIHENFHAIFDGIIDETATDPRSMPHFPMLFIKGEKSQYLDTRDIEAIRTYFPQAELSTVTGAGHWVHAEQPAQFLSIVDRFIGE